MFTYTDTPTMTFNAWQRLLNLLPSPVALLKRHSETDPFQDQIIFVNQAYLDTIGYAPEDTHNIQQWFNKICPSEAYRDFIVNEWLLQLNKAKHNLIAPLSLPCQICCKNGLTRWFHLNAHHHYPISKDLRLVLLVETTKPEKIIQDLQATTQALMASNLELKKQKRLLKQTQELAKVGSWELDLSTGKMHWSDEIFRIHGIEPGAIEPNLAYFLQKSAPGEELTLKQTLEKAIRTGEKQHLNHRVIRADGDEAIVDLVGYIEFDKNHRPLKAVGSSTDITHLALLQKQNSELAQIVELSHQEIIIFSAEQNRCLYANNRALQNLGYCAEEVESLVIEQINADLTYPQLQKLASEKSEKLATKYLILSQTRKDGSIYPVKSTIQKVHFKNQNAIALFNSDVSQLKSIEQALRRQNQLFDNILQNVPVRIFWQDIEGNYIGANQNFLDDLKLPNLEALLGKTDLDLPWPSGQGHTYYRQDMQVLKEGHTLLQMEDAFIDDDGNIQIWLLSKLPLRDNNGKIIGMLGTYQDISTNRQLEIQLKEQAQTLQHQAFHDALTKLPNRVYLNQQIEQEILIAERNQSQFALLFIDLDHFKQINDSLGHDIGDQVLQAMAKRLKANLRTGDTLARLGGDEFTVIQTPLKQEEDAATLAKKLIDATSEPICIANHTFYLSNSIGISIYPKDAISAESLLRTADAAMYLAKDQGRNNFQFYTSNLTDQAFAHLSMQTQIRQAIDNNEFIPYFQPQIDSIQQKIIGLEVLARWQTKDGKIIAPIEFIQIAEKTGLIIPLDRQVMLKAIHHFLRWRKQGLIDGKLSLNLAVKQLEQDDFFEFVNTLLCEVDCNPEWLEFEITESDIMTKLDEMTRKMSQLRQLGIKIAIDDFGTGYSSLAYLKKLPVSKLKIDQSFIRDLPQDEDDAVITKTIISMADNLGLKVIAEGVETMEQQAFLQANGCEQIQGYLYSKPLNADDIEIFLRQFPDQAKPV
ncbi:hypothetical protein THMIRHAS_09810 [Thiosulfatimonas sediminis]|uniref:GGDEF domain-containing protein n=1 Tax=Thiosulfatimonas sediminis TaxID=2675054 RepID=A0A6F8PUC6_9GAMM|nr:EAL domain-containing protein [Thiosulfatimonas sediminis]BBP45608.1 hypothetical protein THMIRHAS_09810 [Thiosulfatimonas sediminis]